MENNFDTANINIEWLNNIYNEIKIIQDIERNSREGCNNLLEYLSFPDELKNILLADVQYKNIRFFALELDILIGNLSPIIPDKIEKYSSSLKIVLKNINNKDLFIDERRINNKVVEVYTLPFFHSTLNFLIDIKKEIISDIKHILFIKPEEVGRKKW